MAYVPHAFIGRLTREAIADTILKTMRRPPGDLTSVLEYFAGKSNIERDVYVRAFKVGYNETPQGRAGR